MELKADYVKKYETTYQKMGTGRTVFLLLFGVVFSIVGLLLFCSIEKDVYQILDTYRWERSQGTILSSQIDQDQKLKKPFKITVEYKYLYGGQVFNSNRLALKPKSYNSYAEALQDIGFYPPGKEVAVYINPGDYTQVILKRESLFYVLQLFFPLPFIAFGFFCLYETFNSLKRK